MGEINYNGYRNFTNGISLVDGSAIPEWDRLPTAIQLAWEAGAKAAVDAVMNPK